MSEAEPEAPLARPLAAALQDFEEYIAAFNAKNLPRVAHSLAEDVAVLVNGVEVARGRDSILPSYEKDFKAGKSVTVMRGPTATTVPTAGNLHSDNDASENVQQNASAQSSAKEVHVSVSLRTKEIAAGERTDLDVVYVYDPVANRQIRHEISNVCAVPSN